MVAACGTHEEEEKYVRNFCTKILKEKTAWKTKA
jgi:hypothetical protein